MTVDQARFYILEQKGRTEYKKVDFDALNEAFRIYWQSEPSRDEFSHVMGRVILTSTMLYDMVCPVVKMNM